MTPVAVALISYGIDSLLTLIPLGGFDRFIRSLGPMGMTMDLMKSLSDPSGVMDPSDLQDYSDAMNMVERLGSGEVLNYLVGLLFTTGLFMMGNLLFKTHKTGKTFGIMIGVSYILSMIMQMVLISGGIFNFTEEVDFNSIANMVSGMMWGSILLNAILTLALYVGIFFKLKTQKY